MALQKSCKKVKSEYLIFTVKVGTWPGRQNHQNPSANGSPRSDSAAIHTGSG